MGGVVRTICYQLSCDLANLCCKFIVSVTADWKISNFSFIIDNEKEPNILTSASNAKLIKATDVAVSDL